MCINNSTSTSFGRAFTTKEKLEYKQITGQARNLLGTDSTSLIIFDTVFPTKSALDTGVGSSFSKSAQKLITFMKDMLSINTVQLGPQGIITKSNYSPYSGSSFSLGNHLIDLSQLNDAKYGNILPEKILHDAINANDLSENEKKYKTNYSKVLGKDKIKEDIGTQDQALHIAFSNFKNLDKSSALKNEFDKFTNNPSDWLERDSLFEALKEKHGTEDWKTWNDEIDKNLFDGKYPQDTVSQRINEIKSEHNEAYEFNKFCQFIASKQQKESKDNFKNSDISLAGDCLIGFSIREHWAYKSAFLDDVYMGCQNDDHSVEPWGFPVVNYNELGTPEKPLEAGKLLQNKFDLFFQRYDKGRIDAAYQLIQPFLYELDKNGKPVQKPFNELDNRVMSFVEDSARKNIPNFKKEDISLELLGADAWGTLLKTKNDWGHIHLTRYANDGWGRVKAYENTQGYSLDKINIGIGTHDDISLMELTDDKMTEQAHLLANDLKLDSQRLSSDKIEFRNAKFGELFTAKNQFFTIFDVLGLKQQFNKPGIDPITQKPSTDNWSARIPYEFESLYFKQLSEGKGLNLPKALTIAINAKEKSNPFSTETNTLLEKLQKADKILSEKGPFTEEEANAAFGSNTNNIR